MFTLLNSKKDIISFIYENKYNLTQKEYYINIIQRYYRRCYIT